MILSPAAFSSTTARTIAVILPLVKFRRGARAGREAFGKECGTQLWERVPGLKKCVCPVYLPKQSTCTRVSSAPGTRTQQFRHGESPTTSLPSAVWTSPSALLGANATS